jgi:hypothetical protein
MGLPLCRAADIARGMRTPEYLEDQARRCRSLAESSHDEKLALTLRLMAEESEAEARRLRAAQEAPDR